MYNCNNKGNINLNNTNAIAIGGLAGGVSERYSREMF